MTVTVTVPEDSGTVYLTGNHPQFGPWAADGLAMDGTGTVREAAFTLPPSEELQYKFTLGDWSREAVDENGFPYRNFVLTAEDGMDVRHTLAGFKADRQTLLDDWKGSGVIGTLVHQTDIPSEFLELPRNVTVWLPPGYEDPQNADKRYPVVYMTDGENLFDPRIANTGIDWGVDEAMMAGVEAGLFEPAIIVSTWSTAQRLYDYSPWHNGPNYGRFITKELKPRMDQTYRTLTGRENTFAMGSSMGGLLAMHLVTQHADVFSACGCVSTHVPLSERVVEVVMGAGDGSEADPTPYISRDIASGALVPAQNVRYFFDYGTQGLDAEYGPVHEEIRTHFASAGMVEGEGFLVLRYPGADHNEASWRARVGDQLLWLLAGQAPDTPQ
ncbi:MAG: alpha/beta hydrolase-fold protein [Pseudomonadota bacterium]